MNSAEKRLYDLGLDFPEKNRKGQGAVQYKLIGDLLYIGGIAPIGENGEPAYKGRVGIDFTLEEGYKAARLVGINMLQIIKDALGTLDRVDYIVKVMAMVSAKLDYPYINEVSDGFTDLMTEAFGERGKHARNTIGASTLTGNVPIICDAIIKVRNW